MIRMKTVNRRPIKTSVFIGELKIDWVCHGIDQHGKRQKWTERTFTTPVWVETYDNDLFQSYHDYRTIRHIYSPGNFERKQS